MQLVALYPEQKREFASHEGVKKGSRRSFSRVVRSRRGTDCPAASCSVFRPSSRPVALLATIGRPRSPFLPGRTSDRAIEEAVRSSLFQATPSPILKSTPLTFFSSKPRFGKSWVHSGTKPMPSRAETSDTSKKVSYAAIGDIAGQIVFLELLGKVPLTVGEVLARKRDNLLGAQILA